MVSEQKASRARCLTMRKTELLTAPFLVAAGLTLLAELIAVAPGPPNSIPDWLFLWAYYLAPFLLFLGAIIGLVAGIGMLIRARRRGTNWRSTMRLVGLEMLGPVVFILSFYAAPEVRLWGLRRVTSRLTPLAISYLRSTGANPSDAPVLDVRGCTGLEMRKDAGDEPTLVAECNRGIGADDELQLRLSARYPGRSVSRLGAWAYVWD
jgi:hypothetical protein